MKKYLLAISGLLGVQALWGAPLSPDEALARLSSPDMPARVREASGQLRLARTVKTDAGNPAVYVFSRQSGQTLFVSADDLARPLLGYTDRMPQGELPPQLEWWLSEYAREIAHMRPHTTPAPTPRATTEDAAREEIPPLLTTRWDQTYPYNLQCPEVDGVNCVTGCAATATAQIMNYFRYPERGTGSITYSPSEDYVDYEGMYREDLSMDFSEVTFDWDNMLPSYIGGEATDAQIEAVCTLMNAAGHATRTTYGTAVSVASEGTCMKGMQEFFGYNEKARMINRTLYSRSAWESIIYDNLKTVGPLLYFGNNIGLGHVFVCDGYSDGYFHFNWGWSGWYDGMFSLSALSPGIDEEEGYTLYDWSHTQRAVINLNKPGADTIDVDGE